MKIIIKTKNLELTDGLQVFVDKKIGSIKKYINILKEDTPEKGKTLAEVFVELKKETKHHRKGNIFLVKAMINLPGRIITVSSKADDIFEAIIDAKDELKTEIKKYKFKNSEKNLRQRMKPKGEM
jgi:ribosomal subunit interface protein